MTVQVKLEALDPVALAAELIRCPSVTPKDAGAIDVLARALEALGFACTKLEFTEPGTEPVLNLYARLGRSGRNFCFAGHTDVVPVGRRESWTVDPFGAEVIDGALYGRGATDMKGSIAAFAAATARFLGARGDGFRRIDQPADHRRRGRRLHQRHEEGAGLAPGAGRAARCLRGG